MSQIPFLVKLTDNPSVPYILEPLNCNTCNGKNFRSVFGSAVLTVAITALGFLVAFGWNSAVQEIFNQHAKNESQLVASKINYAFLITLGAILIVCFLLYFVPGKKC